MIRYMGPAVFYFYAGAQASLCAWSIWLWRTKSAPASGLLAAITAALAYDNVVLASGHILGLGESLELLTRYRYALSQ